MADLLRETFEEYAGRAPDAAGLRDAVAARVRRDRARRRWTVAATAAATAAAGGAGVGVAAPGAGPAPPAEPPNVLYTEPPAPPGTAWLLWRGVEVAVPEAWLEPEFDACGAPTTDGVLVNDLPGDDCAWHPSARLSVLLVTTPRSTMLDRIDGWRNVTVSGVPARRGSGPALIDQAEVLVIPRADVALVLATPDRALADRVFRTVRVRDGVDSRGCAIRPVPLGPPPAPARAGADRLLVPEGAVQASVCLYTGEFVAVSRLLDARAVDKLAAALNGPPGGPAEERRPRPVVMTFRYPTGPDVVVHLGAEGVLTNGAATRRVDPPVADALRPLVGWRFTFEQDRLG